MGKATTHRVRWVVEGGVADVRLDRPDKLNALDLAMFDGLIAAGDALRADPSVRAVVLSGEGRAFCAGLDFAAFQAMASRDGASGDGASGDGASGDVGSGLGASGLGASGLGAREEGAITNLAQRAAWIWRELEVPVVAALHGAVLGGGLQIALGADLRFVAPDARLSVLEIRWGLIPDMTGTHVLPRLVGPDRAKELVWSGRMVSGAEAVDIGLATRVETDPRRAAMAFAAEVAAQSPHAIRAGKALLDASLDRGAGEQFAAESMAMEALIGSPNQVEAVAAFFDQRDPVFAEPA